MARRRGRAYPRAWYDRPTSRVARDLLGSELVVRGPEGERVVRIVETEAYVARDPANHAFRGETTRNRAMFGRPGTLYVFRIHQVHCLNVVTRPGQAVLIRAAEPLAPRALDPRGPGRLCRALGVDRSDDGSDVLHSRISIRAGGPRRDGIVRGPRVGIRRGVEPLLRYALRGNPWVSRPWPRGQLTGAWPSRSSAGGRYGRTRRKRTRASAGGTSGDRSADR